MPNRLEENRRKMRHPGSGRMETAKEASQGMEMGASWAAARESMRMPLPPDA
jgi:hypothetical protein